MTTTRTPPHSSGNSSNDNKVIRSTFMELQQQQQQRPVLRVNGIGATSCEGTDDNDDTSSSDKYNYALLIALYTLQGIPMGLSASIPFLIQQKVGLLLSASTSAVAAAEASGTTVAAAAALATTTNASIVKMAYNAQAIFALCSWPFSLKLFWAPIVDALYWKRMGRRKSWLVPVQTLAGILMLFGSDFVETQLGLEQGNANNAQTTGAADFAAKSIIPSNAIPTVTTFGTQFNVKGVTVFFFLLYFLMATQDIAVDGWALTMLSKKNRGRGPVCNCIGQNLGYFLSFVGFLALNDAESSENLWRPLFGFKSRPGVGIVSLGSFIRFMGMLMLAITTFVALFKKEDDPFFGNGDDEGNISNSNCTSESGTYESLPFKKKMNIVTDDAELDASEIGIRETYHRLWAVCQLPAVHHLFLILLTYRLPTALSDNVKFLKAVEFGLSKQTTALLSPTLILPLGIAVPIVATKIWKGHPLRQFMTAYKIRVTLVALLDVWMLLTLQNKSASRAVFWCSIIGSTASQAIVQSLQVNAQMTFFASRVDPAIGGSYMTLLNTAANLGGTWPASIVMYLVGALTAPPTCTVGKEGNMGEVCTEGRDSYFPLQIVFSILGCLWIHFMGHTVKHVAELPDDAWKTHVLEDEEFVEMEGTVESGSIINGWNNTLKKKDAKAE